MKLKTSLLSISLTLSTLTLASVSHAQEVGDPVKRLSDLVGARAGQAENELKKRGYQFAKAGEASGGASYTYWRETRTKKCITIQTKDGRYQSFVYALPESCGTVASHSTPKKRETPENLISKVPPALKDLVGARAGQAEDDLVGRGYTYRNTVTFEGGKSAYYIENKTGYCVEVGTVDGRFSSIVYNSSDRCKASN
ncbi:hypothetical protein V0288_21085 [Pannus brasiliensis CCIBt3594]|uniref:PepSY domain-containing protein n=1 Tax=Pannus brasiliensis CCIBt3594 TaxID=1427578 RepID=A0AAW9QPF0_9CHRO